MPADVNRVRTIGVVTVARSDYGIYIPLLRRISSDSELSLSLIATGMHLSTEFGRTEDMIEADGFTIDHRIEMLLSADTPSGISKSIGLGVIGFAQLFAECRPDILVLLGDRYEMCAAAIAALPFKLPVAHIHGGEVTSGAIDDALRHSITKLSHLHFPATSTYARRLVQLGEEPWRITVSGAPSLENLREIRLMSVAEVERRYGISLNRAPLLVTYHPVTLEYEQTERHMKELLAALEKVRMPVVFTMPNADTSSRVIQRSIQDFVRRHSSAWIVENLGTQGYFSLMSFAAAMVGNSSSGIIEAPSFKLPVVNIGSRQDGRLKAANTIDVGYSCDEIVKAISKAVSTSFREDLSSISNPHESDGPSQTIVSRLKRVPLDDTLTTKRFRDLPI